MSPLMRAYLLLFAGFLYLPIVVLAIFSFNASQLMAFPLSGFTLNWYASLAANQTLLTGLLTSFLIAQPVAILTSALGLMAGLALTAERLPWRTAFVAILLVPFILPKGVLAIGQIMLMSQFGIPRGPLPLILSEALVILPFTTLILTAVLVRLDRGLEEAARDLGATPLVAFRRVILPQLRGGLIAAYSVGVILSLADLTLSMFLAGRTQPLSVIVSSAFRTRLSPDLNAMQVTVLALTVLVVIAVEIVRRRAARSAAVAVDRDAVAGDVPAAAAS
jgi:spermidine/putrescine transport system permease protein